MGKCPLKHSKHITSASKPQYSFFFSLFLLCQGGAETVAAARLSEYRVMGNEIIAQDSLKYLRSCTGIFYLLFSTENLVYVKRSKVIDPRYKWLVMFPWTGDGDPQVLTPLATSYATATLVIS